MPAPGQPKLNSKQAVLLAVLGGIVLLVMGVLAYLLITLKPPNEAATAAPKLSLPTAPAPTITLGPPAPLHIQFVAQKPIKGYSSCTYFGVKGKVNAGNGTALQNVQIMVWSKEKGMLALTAVAAGGEYSIRLPGRPEPRQLWVQVVQNDAPVSEPVPVATQLNCQTGYQIYQVDWQRRAP